MHKVIWFLLFVILTAASSDAAVVYPFEGEFDFRTKEFNITVLSKEDGKAVITNRLIEDKGYELSAKIDHFNTESSDLSSDFTAVFTKSVDVDNAIVYNGTLNTQYMLVDFKPIRELSGDFFIKDKVLTFSSLKFGGVNCTGSFDFESPHAVNLAINIDRIPMDKFLDVWQPSRTYDADGLVSGIIKVTGDLDALYLKGKLDGADGYIKTFDFDEIHLDIEGVYPHLQIAQSKVLKKDGLNFEFEGPINLRDRKNFKKQIKELTFKPVVRGSESEREWTIRQVKDDSTGATSLKYLLRKETDDVSGMLGIEKSLEF